MLNTADSLASLPLFEYFVGTSGSEFMTGRLECVAQERAEAVLERVLHFRGDSTFVQLPGPSADADAIERYVQIGLSDGIDVEIISGLEVGDTVLEKAAREIE